MAKEKKQSIEPKTVNNEFKFDEESMAKRAGISVEEYRDGQKSHEETGIMPEWMFEELKGFFKNGNSTEGNPLKGVTYEEWLQSPDGIKYASDQRLATQKLRLLNANKRQATINIKVNENVKEAAESVLDGLGISMSAAIGIFLRQVAQESKIPFEIKYNADYWTDRYFKISKGLGLNSESLEDNISYSEIIAQLQSGTSE
jgi:DNA-damage-inducible protein J